MNTLRSVASHPTLACIAALGAGYTEVAQPCTPQWEPVGAGLGGVANGLAVFEDGGGCA